MMNFPFVIVLLLVALYNTEANTVNQKSEPCDGGHCVPKHLCPTGSSNNVPILGQRGVIALEVDGHNECSDFMKICCKKLNTNSNLADSKCGISNPEGLVYQVKSNLTYAKYAEFPWTVALFVIPFSPKSLELTYVGGGTLIHPKIAISAAHTLRKSYRHMARFGEWNIESDAEIYPTQDIEVEAFALHPSYRETFTPDIDIAIVLLKAAVTYTEHIRPLCLPSEQDVFVGNRCIAASWGWDARTGQSASIMKRMELKVVHRRRCQMLYQQLGIAIPQEPNVMCAIADVDQNACMKEDGTPLICQRDDGSYVLAGLALRQLDCDQSDDPAVFVNVAKFAGWLQTSISQYEEWL